MPSAQRSIDRHTKREKVATQGRPGAQKPCGAGKDMRPQVKRTGGGQYNWGDDLQDWMRENKCARARGYRRLMLASVISLYLTQLATGGRQARQVHAVTGSNQQLNGYNQREEECRI